MRERPTRIHQGCGQPMTATFFSHNDPTPQFRSQPIWACACGRWEPHEDWAGPLPTNWDGQRWIVPS
jgi:hypothetical protein